MSSESGASDGGHDDEDTMSYNDYEASSIEDMGDHYSNYNSDEMEDPHRDYNTDAMVERYHDYNSSRIDDMEHNYDNNSVVAMETGAPIAPGKAGPPPREGRDPGAL